MFNVGDKVNLKRAGDITLTDCLVMAVGRSSSGKFFYKIKTSSKQSIGWQEEDLVFEELPEAMDIEEAKSTIEEDFRASPVGPAEEEELR